MPLQLGAHDYLVGEDVYGLRRYADLLEQTLAGLPAWLYPEQVPQLDEVTDWLHVNATAPGWTGVNEGAEAQRGGITPLTWGE